MRVTLCIPLYNEEKILPDTLRQVKDYMKEAFGEDYEILFIDDGSSDGSLALLEGAADDRTRAISYKPNRGKGYAVRQGMLAGEGDVILFTDCDLAYGLEKVKEMVEALEAHPEWAGLVGSRHLEKNGYEGYTFLRKVASSLYLWVLKVYGGLKLSDSQCGIKAFRREAAREIFSLCQVDRFSFDFEALLLADFLGHKIGEHPVTIINHRESKIHLVRDACRMLKDLRRMKKRLKQMKKERKQAQKAQNAGK